MCGRALPEQLLITCVLNNCLVWFKVSLLYLVSLQPACVFDEIIKAKGLPPPQLQHICQALIISRILYAVSAWGVFLSAELRNRINGFFHRLYKYGYTPALVDMEQLLCNADETLFCKALKDVYCLHHLLPELDSLFSSGPLITTTTCQYANTNCTNVLLLSAVFLISILIISKIVFIVTLL